MNEKDIKLRQEIAELKLTDKQKSFCEEYLVDFDPARAARRAGYRGRNQRQVAEQLLQGEAIQAYIAILKKEVSERVGIRLDDVLREYMRIGFANIEDLASWTKGTISLTPSAKLSRDQMAAIASVENTREGIKVKMLCKLEALGKLNVFCEEKERSPGDKKSGETTININEIRVALGNPQTRKALDQVSSVFLGRKLKNLEHLDSHVAKVTHAIAAPDSGTD